MTPLGRGRLRSLFLKEFAELATCDYLLSALSLYLIQDVDAARPQPLRVRLPLCSRRCPWRPLLLLKTLRLTPPQTLPPLSPTAP